jgi:hypothetical protein
MRTSTESLNVLRAKVSSGNGTTRLHGLPLSPLDDVKKN